MRFQSHHGDRQPCTFSCTKLQNNAALSCLHTLVMYSSEHRSSTLSAVCFHLLVMLHSRNFRRHHCTLLTFLRLMAYSAAQNNDHSLPVQGSEPCIPLHGCHTLTRLRVVWQTQIHTCVHVAALAPPFALVYRAGDETDALPSVHRVEQPGRFLSPGRPCGRLTCMSLAPPFAGMRHSPHHPS